MINSMSVSANKN